MGELLLGQKEYEESQMTCDLRDRGVVGAEHCESTIKSVLFVKVQ